jgi:hypothetical protein
MIDQYIFGNQTVGICRITGNYLLKSYGKEWHKFRYIYESHFKEEAWVCPESETTFPAGGVYACPGCGKFHLCISKNGLFYLFTDKGELFDIDNEIFLQDEILLNMKFADEIYKIKHSAWLEHQFIIALPAGKEKEVTR